MLTVFGSINLDISVGCAHLPRPGETLLGTNALLSPGGKGANQAHAARRFGVPARLFGKVGGDAFAGPALAKLADSDVDLSGVEVAGSEATGLATITVTQTGENAIIVAPGANLAASASQVSNAVLRASRVLLLQLEVPWPESQALARRARSAGCKVVLNASPLPQGTSLELDAVDLLIVNSVELDQLCTQHGIGGSTVERARRLADAQHIDVLVTLGADGSLLMQADGQQIRAPALPVKAVDTTGAGDTYAGVLCAAMASGETPQQAMAFASVAASLACLRAGAQLAQPSRAEIDARVGELVRGENLCPPRETITT
jgi:ribokinase